MSSCAQNCCDFAGSYDLSRLPEIKKLEEAALGCDYGGTSWTTREQVEAVVGKLRLNSASQLLDIGSGAGWPGLLLGQLSNCNVTLLDIPLNALQQAAQRAAADSMCARVNIVAASGTAMPFEAARFDRISHSDVLCCLEDKLALLLESRRVAMLGAVSHFSVILPAAGISASEYDEVLRTGPPFVGVEGTYSDLLRKSGWREAECADVTDEYRGSLERLVQATYEFAPELIQLLGEDELVARRQHRQDQIDLIDRDLMRREAYLAIAN